MGASRKLLSLLLEERIVSVHVDSIIQHDKNLFRAIPNGPSFSRMWSPDNGNFISHLERLLRMCWNECHLFRNL